MLDAHAGILRGQPLGWIGQVLRRDHADRRRVADMTDTHARRRQRPVPGGDLRSCSPVVCGRLFYSRVFCSSCVLGGHWTGKGACRGGADNGEDEQCCKAKRDCDAAAEMVPNIWYLVSETNASETH